MAVRWNIEQVKQLEQAFPELTGSTDANALLVNAGRREVILYIRNAMRNQQPTHSNIPEEILYGDGVL